MVFDFRILKLFFQFLEDSTCESKIKSTLNSFSGRNYLILTYVGENAHAYFMCNAFYMLLMSCKNLGRSALKFYQVCQNVRSKERGKKGETERKDANSYVEIYNDVKLRRYKILLEAKSCARTPAKWSQRFRSRIVLQYFSFANISFLHFLDLSLTLKKYGHM